MNKKREAREFCFQFFFHFQLPIYEAEKMELLEDQEHLTKLIEQFRMSLDSKLEGPLFLEVKQRITNCLSNYSEIKELVNANLKNWKLERLAKVDLTLLILGTQELCFEKKLSSNIVINEAVELAKKYGTQESAAFINGVLDKIAKDHE